MAVVVDGWRVAGALDGLVHRQLVPGVQAPGVATPDVDDRIRYRLAGGRVDRAQGDEQRRTGLPAPDLGHAGVGTEVERAFDRV